MKPDTDDFAQLYAKSAKPVPKAPAKQNRRKCTKIGHATAEDAWKHAESLQSAGWRRSAVYRCWRCGKWHVTRKLSK